jgi:hypothetical protein
LLKFDWKKATTPAILGNEGLERSREPERKVEIWLPWKHTTETRTIGWHLFANQMLHHSTAINPGLLLITVYE